MLPDDCATAAVSRDSGDADVAAVRRNAGRHGGGEMQRFVRCSASAGIGGGHTLAVDAQGDGGRSRDIDRFREDNGHVKHLAAFAQSSAIAVARIRNTEALDDGRLQHVDQVGVVRVQRGVTRILRAYDDGVVLGIGAACIC